MYNFDYDLEHLPLYLPVPLTQLKSYNKWKIHKSIKLQYNHSHTLMNYLSVKQLSIELQ